MGFIFQPFKSKSLPFWILPDICSSQNTIEFALWNSCSHLVFNSNHHLPELLSKPNSSTHRSGNIPGGKPNSSNSNKNFGSAAGPLITSCSCIIPFASSDVGGGGGDPKSSAIIVSCGLPVLPWRIHWGWRSHDDLQLVWLENFAMSVACVILWLLHQFGCNREMQWWSLQHLFSLLLATVSMCDPTLLVQGRHQINKLENKEALVLHPKPCFATTLQHQYPYTFVPTIVTLSPDLQGL